MNLPFSLLLASGNLSLVQSALKKGGSPNWLDEKGASALHKAAECGSVEIIDCLVQAGAVLDEQLLASKNTPLHIAARKVGLVFSFRSIYYFSVFSANGTSCIYLDLVTRAI